MQNRHMLMSQYRKSSNQIVPQANSVVQRAASREEGILPATRQHHRRDGQAHRADTGKVLRFLVLASVLASLDSSARQPVSCHPAGFLPGFKRTSLPGGSTAQPYWNEWQGIRPRRKLTLLDAPPLQLRGGMPTINVGSTPKLLETEEVPEIEMLKASLDPKKYPPLEPEYGEDGDMIVPPPMSLENFGTVDRLLDESGRLLTSREAEKQGATRFKKKPKGRNSLEKRCTCGNKMPCDGDVVITKNEHGKLEYHKIPRYFIGPAHQWECMQPAQYMVTPSSVNKTELFGHCPPLLLHQVADLMGVTVDEAQSYADPALVNATLQTPCHFCNDPSHRYYMCPSLEDDDEETLKQLRRRKEELEQQLADKSHMQELHREGKESLENELRACTTRVELNDLYAPLKIEHNNRTYWKNMPGTNWARGECSAREYLLANEVPPTIPDAATIMMPEQVDKLPALLRHWPGNLTISAAPGQHKWVGQAFLKNPNWHPRPRLDHTTHELHVAPREAPAGTQPPEQQRHRNLTAEEARAGLVLYGGLRPRFWHRLRSVGGPGGREVLERAWMLQNAALLLGRWLFQPDTRGSFTGVSCFHRAWSHPEVHAGELLEEFEEEANEIGERFRPASMTDDLFLVHDGSWRFDECDLLADDAVALRMVEEAQVSVRRCLVGAPGFIVHGPDSLEKEAADGFAYVGIEVEGGSELQIAASTVQLTQVAGIRLSDDARAAVDGCELLHTGCMGGAGLAMLEHCSATLHDCLFRPGGSLSPIWNLVLGAVWASTHRPRTTVVEECSFEAEPLWSQGVEKEDCRAKALAEGQKDPVQIWVDSRYECWWPRERLAAIGLFEQDFPVDGNGGFRQIRADDIESDSDLDDVEVLLNTSKHVTLRDWGWEGTLEDAYDTGNAMAVNYGVWELREDVHRQLDGRDRLDFKKQRARRAEQRRGFAKVLLLLRDGEPKQRIHAAKAIADTADAGDLSALFWLQQQVDSHPGKKVLSACERAHQRLQVTEEEIGAICARLQTVQLDEEGSTNETIAVSGVEFAVADIPPAIRAALCPDWPLYPQHNDVDPLPLASARVDADQPSDAPTEDAMEDEGELDRTESRNGSLPVGGNAHKYKANVTRTVVKKIRLEKLEEDAKHLTVREKVELAKAGFMPFPTEEELVAEINNRTVDDWFRIMEDPAQEMVWVQLLREYAESFGMEVPAAAEAQRKRKKLEKELALTQDYLAALEMSTQLHLTELEWRALYPQLDSERLVEPPSNRKLDEVARRIEKLERQLAFVKDEERFALMEAVYPLAKEVEDAFARNDKQAIMEMTKRKKKGYGVLGAFADGLLKVPFRVSEDGAYLIRDTTPDAFRRS